MNEPTIAQTVLFPDLVARPLIATFDQSHASSDGGAILLNLKPTEQSRRGMGKSLSVSLFIRLGPVRRLCIARNRRPKGLAFLGV